MSFSDPSGRAAGGASVPWWWRWVATVAGAGIFSWALAAILHGGRPAAGTSSPDPAGRGPQVAAPGPAADPLAADPWQLARPGDSRQAWEWESEREREEREADEDWEEEWDDRDRDALWLRSGPGAPIAPPGGIRRAPDARSRPS